MTASDDARFRVADGEEARLTPGAAADAEVWSRGSLPLRVRAEGSYRLRPAFPGTAVALGSRHYEVLSETELPEDGLFVYRLRLWPASEVVRDRVVYGAALVRAAQARRDLARSRARARPFRVLLYPLVGLLPEEDQVVWSERLGLYAVTATLVSGLVEALAIVLAPVLAARLGAAQAIGAVSTSALFSMLALPALGRAFGAFFLGETGGSAPVVALVEALRALGLRLSRPDRSVLPLTRQAFWERLARPDTVTSAPDGSFVYRGLLPHLSWDGSHRLESGGDFWQPEPEPPALDRGRLVHAYHLVPMAEPAAGAAPQPPAPLAYADEVLAQVRREWDEWNVGFVWVTSLLHRELQERAFDHRGGPRAARRATLGSAALTALAGVYVLGFLPGASGDPLAPFAALLAAALLADGLRRWLAIRGGRYAPSLLRVLVPSDLLRPERIAYHAHRDAERRILESIRPSR
jgi:hypothetical protein